MSDVKASGPTILQKIYAQRAKDVEKAKSTPGTTPTDLQAQIDMCLAPPLIDVVQRLRRNPSTTSHATHTPSLMAEIKRASPSKGPIAPTVNAAGQAQAYALAGASLISVLTEPTWFLGSLTDMRLARETLSTLPDRPAVLRKDFILDEYQIDEARLWGADCVLLIVAMLNDERLGALYDYSKKRGMEPLVEVNNEEEMKRALALDAKLVGVNNRNLHSFDVDMSTTSRLSAMLSDHPLTILCALSGISSPEDIIKYAAEGVRGVLIGESLMRASNPSSFIRTLFNWPSPTSGLTPFPQQGPWVKINGAITEQEVLYFIKSGAQMVGIHFNTDSPRSVEGGRAEVLVKAVRDYQPASGDQVGPMPVVPVASTPSVVPSTLIGPHENAPWWTTQVHHVVSFSRKPLVVGIFKNQTLATIVKMVYLTKLDLVELTGSEPLEWALQIPVPVIRHINLEHLSQSSSEQMRSELKPFLRPGLHAFLSIAGCTETSWVVTRAVLRENGVSGWGIPVICTEHVQQASGSNDGRAEGAAEPLIWARELEFGDDGGVLEDVARKIKAMKGPQQ